MRRRFLIMDILTVMFRRIALTGIVVFLSAGLLFAQRGEIDYPEFHYVTVSASGGYTNLLSDIENVRIPGSGGVLLGVGYEYRVKLFWLGLGVQGSLINSSLIADDMVIDKPMRDQEGEDMTYHYQIQRWSDRQMMLDVDVPFMLGVCVGRFYMGAGVKAGLNVYGHSASALSYRTSASYDRFPDDFQDMPNHWYDNFDTRGKTPLHFGMNMAALLEVGGEVLNLNGTKKRLPMRMKVGAYAEYGFISVYKNAQPSDPFIFDETNPAIVLPVAYYKSANITSPVNPLFVGVRLTLMFELPVPQRCNCLQTENGASWRNTAPKVTREQNRKVKKGVRKKD